jgi:hypothetical protein
MGLRPCQNRNGHEKEEAVTPASLGKMLLQVIVDIRRRFRMVRPIVGHQTDGTFFLVCVCAGRTPLSPFKSIRGRS